MTRFTAPNLAQKFVPVKSQFNTQLPLFSDTMIHHKADQTYIVGNTLEEIIKKGKRYGVSSSYKVLTKGLLLRKFDLVRDCLEELCELPPAERDMTLQLLRLQAYYPQVYPKASQVASDTCRGVATFWRTVNKLQDMNLLKVVNRFLRRPEAQISNLYLLDPLILLIARYLAEHGVQFNVEWLKPYLQLPGSIFWGWWVPSLESSPDPGG